MASLIVVLIIVGCAVLQYFKGTVVRAFRGNAAWYLKPQRVAMGFFCGSRAAKRASYHRRFRISSVHGSGPSFSAVVLTTAFGFGTLTVRGTAMLLITGGSTRVLCEGPISLKDLGRIEFLPGTHLDLYVDGPVTVRGNAKVNTTGLVAYDATRLNLIALSGNIDVRDSASFCGLVQGYGSRLTVRDFGSFAGTFTGRKAEVLGSAQVHLDTGSSATPATFGGGCDLAKLATAGVRWIEGPSP